MAARAGPGGGGGGVLECRGVMCTAIVRAAERWRGGGLLRRTCQDVASLADPVCQSSSVLQFPVILDGERQVQSTLQGF